MPVGNISAYWGLVSPNSNYLVCDGSVYNTTTYPDLFILLGVNTTPDLRGYFLRGLDASTTVDPDVRTLGSI